MVLASHPERRGGDHHASQPADRGKSRRAVGGLAAAVHNLLVLLYEAEAIDLLVDQEIHIADAGDAHRRERRRLAATNTAGGAAAARH